LPLEKLVNEKYSPVNGKHFPVNGKYFSVKEKFDLVFRKSVFFFCCICFPENGFQEIIFQTFLCLFAIMKVDQRKTLSSQRKIWLGFQENIFLENLSGKHFLKVVKKLEMLFLLIISNLIFKLFIAIYILF